MSCKKCDICIDQKCGGKKNCNCETCPQKDSCYRELRPIIRIGLKCTQSCSHCCFECSPTESKEMTIETAKNINKFLLSNEIRNITIMGGEFFCHSDWELILKTLSNGISFVRLVSNGDWADSEAISNKLISFLKGNKQFFVAISKDKWHTNDHVDKAVSLLKENLIPHNTPTADQITEDSIVPTGRSIFSYGIYSSFASYCYNPEKKYVFLIDEEGIVNKCPLGGFEYADIHDYLNGGFNERFKEFSTKFYSCFIPNCRSCERIKNNIKWNERKEKQK